MNRKERRAAAKHGVQAEASPSSRFRYVFSGVVLPERALIDLGPPLIFDTPGDGTAGLVGRISIAIYKNQVICNFFTEQRIGDVDVARDSISSIVQGVVDTAGLERAVGYTVEIRSATDGEGMNRVFGVGAPEIGPSDNDFVQLDITHHTTLVGTNAHFRRAIADFRLAILNPVDTGLYCRRATEALMRFMAAERGLTERQTAEGWSELGRGLAADEGALHFIRDLGKDVRHGKSLPSACGAALKL